MLKAIVAAVAAAVLTYGATVVTSDSPAPSSADRTVWSAIHASNHNNMGRFCSYLSQEQRDARCYADHSMDVRVVPGTRTENEDGTVSYEVAPRGYEDHGVKVTVAKQPNGKWRIESFA